MNTQESFDRFYRRNGPCCAGCDWWKWYGPVIGECRKSAPVGSEERTAMLNIESCSLPAEAGHVITTRDHMCGDFVDTHEWPRTWKGF